MNRLLFILLFCIPLLPPSYAQKIDSSTYKSQFPLKPVGWINDFEHIFSEAQKAELDSIISNFEKETTIEIVIVTIDSSYSTKEKFDSLILLIGNQWGVGKQDLNNGVVIGLSKRLRKIRIINGYGIARLSGNDTKRIIDEVMIPEYKQGNYFEGTKKGLLTIIQMIR